MRCCAVRPLFLTGCGDCTPSDVLTRCACFCPQARGFYCALPMDPKQTHMECKPQAIPKPTS